MNSDSPNTADIVERLLRTFEIGVDADQLRIAAIGETAVAYRNPDGPEAAAIITRYEAMLTKCRDKFLHYEQLHRLKCTSDGDEKADRNRDMADEIDAALKDHRKAQAHD